MAIGAPKICSHPGCNKLTIRGRCQAHQPKDTTAQHRQKSRALDTDSARWRRIRKKQLHKEPLCVECQSKGLLTPARIVDHIDGDSWNNSESNLQSMCWSCHSRKTARQDGGFGNRK